MLQNLSPDSFQTILSFIKDYQETYTKLVLVNSIINEIISRIEQHHNEFIMYSKPIKNIGKKFKNISFFHQINIE